MYAPDLVVVVLGEVAQAHGDVPLEAGGRHGVLGVVGAGLGSAERTGLLDGAGLLPLLQEEREAREKHKHTNNEQTTTNTQTTNKQIAELTSKIKHFKNSCEQQQRR
jgi:hypothetical protein